MVKTHRRQRQDQMFNSPTQLSKLKHTQKKIRVSMQALVLKIPVASNGTDDGWIGRAGSQLHPSVRALDPSEARFLLSWSRSGERRGRTTTTMAASKADALMEYVLWSTWEFEKRVGELHRAISRHSRGNFPLSF
jgi:hypothetical protein